MSLLFLLPALDQDQQTYQPLSGMAWEEVWSCYHMCEWSTTSDSGRVRSGRGTISDCWIGDLTTKQWKKV